MTIKEMREIKEMGYTYAQISEWSEFRSELYRRYSQERRNLPLQYITGVTGSI